MRLTRRVHGVFAFFFLVAHFPLPAGAGERPSVAKQIEMAVKGRDLLLERKYDEAESFLKGLVHDWPDELLGTFGLMALDQVRNLDNFDFRFDPHYKTWEEKGREMALKIARAPEEATAWDLLVAGGTLGISGFYRAHNTKWFAALRDASLGFHTFEKAYKKDPTLTDALLGVGLYNYWRTYFTRKLLFLPFFADRREEGKEKLTTAVKESRFSSVLAEISLAFIDFQEKKYEKVLAAVDRLLAKYPNNTILRTLKGESLLRLKRYREAVKEFEAVLSIDPKVTKSYLYMGLALADEGKDKTKAEEYLRKYLELEPKAPNEWRKPALEKLKR